MRGLLLWMRRDASLDVYRNASLVVSCVSVLQQCAERLPKLVSINSGLTLAASVESGGAVAPSAYSPNVKTYRLVYYPPKVDESVHRPQHGRVVAACGERQPNIIPPRLPRGFSCSAASGNSTAPIKLLSGFSFATRLQDGACSRRFRRPHSHFERRNANITHSSDVAE